MSMTLFGTTLDATQIAGLVFLILALVLPLAALDRKRNYLAQFRQWGANRKAKKDVSPEKVQGDAPLDGPKRGPWG